jgi:ribosome modulation factor
MPNDTTTAEAPATQERQEGGVAAVAALVAGITSADPALSAYEFGDLGSYVRFAELMAKGGEMLPTHLQRRTALCLAVTMRAVHWGFDPYALAMETFQAKDGGPIGYQAKVFMAVARKNGILLRYRYEGTVTVLDKPVLSAGGKQVAKRTATGDRRCIVSAFLDGDEFTYETPRLDDITIKNSPLWHNEPDQQLAYFGGRGWMRRYRPDLMMGVRSDDEAVAANLARDVTPGEGRTSFATKALAARQEAAKPSRAPKEEARIAAQVEEARIITEASAGSPDVPPHWTSYEPAEFDPAAAEFEEGSGANRSGEPSSACPYLQGTPQADDWLAGWHDERRVR